ncbi:4-hydroxy-tetrahydrodipicolinate synthase [Paraburkholderia steynii]|uniref:4-hydroxy-tetrahydrodipicolinate synthase n=1 Tax=Paraburkholderia steynii TaxID=1245441 RepID=A0A7Z7BBB6_9BURK|nr:4-hydroxy-tetrahydrodipicolinate synthase [Paraburkholderia steynii]SDI55586.1 4-hydroxy-tetrahydrodipicolinate synthase [Paraburkholderia steynii]
MHELSSLKGSITPIITPFKGDAVDYDTYAKLVDWQIVNGGHGVLVNGTTAEPSSLTVSERNRLVDVAIEAAAGRVPVIAATGSQSLAETLELTTHADKAGVNGLLVVTPYYIKPPQRGLIEYYAEVGRRTERPLMIYHIPGRAAVNVDLDTVKAIKERVPNLVGMKHAVNDMGFVTHMLAAFGPEWRVFVGLEELSFPMLTVGACGLMNAVGNLAPRKVSALYEAVARGDLEAGRALHFDLFDLNLAVFFDTNPIPIKYMMKRMGLLPNNEHRLPMMPATRDLEKRLDGVLERAGLI